MTTVEIKTLLDGYKTYMEWCESVISVMFEKDTLKREFRVMGDDKGKYQYVSFSIGKTHTLKIIYTMLEKLFNICTKLISLGLTDIEIDKVNKWLKIVNNCLGSQLH